jgi:hypothetical protein
MAKQKNIFLGIYLPSEMDEDLKQLEANFKTLKENNKLGKRNDKRLQSAGFQYMIKLFNKLFEKKHNETSKIEDSKEDESSY